ncbi:hypothetical protein, partial [Pedobacter sp. ASV12]|uniref:hypothetical protein n=1 Tax=Pedobacter sp. ASV12 TaxID=2795120 RepID=UPI0018EC2916
MISIGYQSLSINVSPLMIERALMLFNLIISEIKKAGGTMNVESHSTLAIFNGEKFILSMREKQSRIKKPEQKYSWTEYDYVASGVLFFKIGENSWNSKEWSDTAYTVIEDKIEDIISYIKLGALKIKEERRLEGLRR